MDKFTKVKRFLCPTCDEPYEHKTDAQDCCTQWPSLVDMFQCRCGKLYWDEQEAEECYDAENLKPELRIF